jgi:hypothetical protein
MADEQQITLDLTGAFIKPYNLQLQRVREDDHCQLTVPKHLLDREARIQGMTPAEYMEKFEAVIHYGSFPGFYVLFQRKVEKNKEGTSGQPG